MTSAHVLRVLAMNVGSSSLKTDLFEVAGFYFAVVKRAGIKAN